jgi:hypothetical protein
VQSSPFRFVGFSTIASCALVKHTVSSRSFTSAGIRARQGYVGNRDCSSGPGTLATRGNRFLGEAAALVGVAVAVDGAVLGVAADFPGAEDPLLLAAGWAVDTLSSLPVRASAVVEWLC